MINDSTRVATTEDLQQRCGHECMKRPGHDGQHFYGYVLGPHSYDRVLEQVRAMRAVIEACAYNEPYYLRDGMSACALCDAEVSEELDEELPQHWEECPYRLAGEFMRTLTQA